MAGRGTEYLKSAAWFIGSLIVILAAAHFMIKPIKAADKKPDVHPPGACWVCHIVRK